MSELFKEYSVKLKAFSLLANLIFIFSIAYMLNVMITGNKDSISSALSLGILGLIAGLFLFYFSRKKRTLHIYNDKIEYSKPKVEFSALWEDVVLIKTFKEVNKQSENLILMTKDESILSISTAFFEREKLIAAFKDMKFLLADKNIRFEDDRDWANL